MTVTELTANLQQTTILTPPDLAVISLQLQPESMTVLDEVIDSENEYEEYEDEEYDYEYEDIMYESSVLTTTSTSTTTITTTAIPTTTTSIAVPKVRLFTILD